MSSTSCCIEVAASPEQLCYVPCSFCNIVLAVSVPCNSLFDIVTVRCGHCTNVWSVNMGMPSGFHQSLSDSTTQNSSSSHRHDQVSVPCNSLFDIVTVRCGHCTNVWSVNMGMPSGFHQSLSDSTTQNSSSSHRHDQDPNHNPSNSRDDLSLSSRYLPVKPPPPSITNNQLTINAPPEKRTRVPSAYNQFIKQEIQRIKATNPNISHREAFSAAAKNWAHFPHIHFGLMLEGNNHQAKLDELSYMQGSKKRLKSTKEPFDK